MGAGTDRREEIQNPHRLIQFQFGGELFSAGGTPTSVFKLGHYLQFYPLDYF